MVLDLRERPVVSPKSEIEKTFGCNPGPKPMLGRGLEEVDLIVYYTDEKNCTWGISLPSHLEVTERKFPTQDQRPEEVRQGQK